MMVSSRLRAAVIKLVKDEDLSETIDHELFSFKYGEQLSEFYNELKQFEGHPTRFKDFLREIRLDSKLGVRQMYEELLHLTSLYARKNEVFHIKSEIGEFSLPDRTMVLIKIKWLFEELLFRIIPDIENNLSFSQDTYIEQSKMVKGNVDWHSTILSSVKRGESFPLKFDCRMNRVHFDTYENLLAAYCVVKLENDAKKILLSSEENDILRTKDFEVLEIIKKQVHLIRSRSHLQGIINKMEKYSRLSLDSNIVRSLESKTDFRIRTGQVAQRAYSELLQWLKNYRGHNLPSDGRMLADFPFHHKQSLDILYQYWVFFRMIDYFVTKQKILIVQTIRKKNNGEEDSFGGFVLSYKGKTFTIHHEYEEAGWTTAKSNPDFAFEYDGKLSILMDPKNWTEASEGSAYHKMLGYLHNLVERGTSVGVLFFSYHGTYQKDDQGIAKPIVKRTVTMGKSPYTLVTCVLHPKDTQTLESDQIFQNVFEIIKKYLKN